MYEKRNVKELRLVAKRKGLKRYSRLNKKDLIKYIRSGKTKYERCVLVVKMSRRANPWAICNYLRK